MNVAIDIVERLDCVIEKIKQECQADAREEGQRQGYKDVARALRPRRLMRQPAVADHRNVGPFIGAGCFQLAFLLVQSVQVLLITGEILSHGSQIQLMLDLRRRHTVGLRISLREALFSGFRSFITRLHRCQDLVFSRLERLLEGFDLRVELFHIGPFRGVGLKQSGPL